MRIINVRGWRRSFMMVFWGAVRDGMMPQLNLRRSWRRFRRRCRSRSRTGRRRGMGRGRTTWAWGRNRRVTGRWGRPRRWRRMPRRGWAWPGMRMMVPMRRPCGRVKPASSHPDLLSSVARVEYRGRRADQQLPRWELLEKRPNVHLTLCQSRLSSLGY